MFSNVCWCINYALIAPLKLRFLCQSFTPQKKIHLCATNQLLINCGLQILFKHNKQLG